MKYELIYGYKYNDYQLQYKNRPYVKTILNELIELTNQSADNDCTVCRFDLRFPQGTQINQSEAQSRIARFWRTLKTKLSSKRHQPSGRKVIIRDHYQVVEISKEKSIHAHCVVVFSTNQVQELNQYSAIGQLMNDVWSEINGVIHPLIQWTNSHQLTPDDDRAKKECVYHLCYLAKTATKFINNSTGIAVPWKIKRHTSMYNTNYPTNQKGEQQ